MPYFEGVFIERIVHSILVEAPNKEAARQYIKYRSLDNYEFENGDYLDMEYDDTHALGDRPPARLHPDDVHCVNAEGELIIPEEQIHPSVRVNEPRLRGGQLPKEDE